jgi:hypothetical protein
MKVFLASSHLGDPELNRAKRIGVFGKLCFQFLSNLVSVQSVIGQEFDDHSLFVVHRDGSLNVICGLSERKFISRRHPRDRDSIPQFL